MTSLLLPRRALLGGLAATLAAPALARPVATPDLQRAIDAAAAAARPFLMAPGTVISTRLRLPEGIHIVGARAGAPVRLTGRGALLAADAARITIENLTLDGSMAEEGDALLLTEGVDDLTLAGCTFTGARMNALVLRRCGGTVRANRIAGARQAGLFALDSSGLTVEGNTVTGCGENGIQIHRSAKGFDGSVVRGNRISEVRADPGGSGEYGNGINTFRAGGVIVEGNVIRACAYSAVRDNGGSNVVIANNVCRDLGETALYVEFAFDGAVLAGNSVENAMTGISLANFGNEGGRLATVSGNLLRRLVRRPHPADKVPAGGVGIAAEADAAITGNTIDTADHAGIALGWGPYLRDVSASGNTIRNAPTGILVSVAPGAGTAAITNNLIARAPLGAVVGTAWDKVTTGDLTKEPPPPQLAVSGNVVR